MNKSTIWMAMAALALASCSKNTLNNDAPEIASDPSIINFNSSTGATKAVGNGLDQVKGGFNVLALTNVGDASEAAFAGIDGSADGMYMYDGTAKVWKWNVPGVADSKKWPEAEKFPMQFITAYPQTTAIVKDNYDQAITMDLDMANQVDLLGASTTLTEKPGNGYAPLNFKHILSQLAFNINSVAGNKVYIQSIRVVNTALDGRTFNYQDMAYSAEPGYIDDNLAITDGTYKAAEGFFYTNNVVQELVFDKDGTLPVASKSGIMMHMPQFGVPAWIDSVDQALETFKTDAEAWKNGNEADPATKLAAWATAAPGASGQPGMMGSTGWKGTRIEVIYRMEAADGTSLVGHKAGEVVDGNEVAADQFIRVGFPLNLNEITYTATNPDNTTTTTKGFEMGKKYTFSIHLGTTSANNGILLDPDYKDENGGSTDKPVDGVDPGDTVTPTSEDIAFDVKVDPWVDATGGVEIK